VIPFRTGQTRSARRLIDEHRRLCISKSNPVKNRDKQKALRIAGGLVLPVIARLRSLPSLIHAQDSRFNNEAANRNNGDGNAERPHVYGQ